MHQQLSEPKGNETKSLTLSNQPSGTNCLTLPVEVRDLIYSFALISSEPIIVWSGQIKTTIIEVEPPTPENDSFAPDVFHNLIDSIVDRVDRDMDFAAMASSRRDLVLGLLQCHPIISHEAAAIFYRGNTFSFHGYHSWRPINLWLESIGSYNQKYLTSLEISM